MIAETILQAPTYRSRARLIGLVVLLFVASVGVHAQTTTGSIVGTVTDPSGSVTPDVKITVTEEGTGATRVLTTNQQGQYAATLLPVGRYMVQAERVGFKLASVTGIQVEVNQTVRTDVALQVGVVTQTVDINAAAPVLKTDRSDIGQVIGSREISELPLNGRDFLQLATLAPGTLPVAHSDSVMQLFGGGVMVNGTDSNANEITLDGIENQDYLLPRVGIKPSPDATQEFKVMTGTYSAAYGRAGGANINVVTKSGDNSFHGDIWEFLRNNALDAHNYFDSPGSTLPPFRQNQFGGTFGGPIVKDKTFFFGSYEGFRQVKQLTVNAVMPTDAQRAGDLSTGPTIYDPQTTRTDPVTGNIIRDPFPGNIIPTDRIAPESTKALQLLFPEPTQQTPNAFNSVFHPVQTSNIDQYLARVDEYVTQKDRMFVRYAQWSNPAILPQFLAGGVPGSANALTDSDKNIVVAYTRIISANMINDARVGFNRYVERSVPADQTNYNDEIGIVGAVTDPSTYGAPQVNITGITGVGPNPYAPSLTYGNGYEYMDTLSLTKAGHSLQFGADIRRAQLNGTQFPFPRGSYGFSGGFSEDPQSPSTTGQGLADFLLGDLSSTYAIFGRTDVDMRSINGGFFAQDDWNVTRDLTLNLGLRYDYMPQPISAGDRIVNWDEKDQAIVLAQNNLNTVPPCAGCNGRTISSLIQDFQGIFNFETRQQAGWPRALAQSDLKDFSPRVGVAWRVFGSSKTVLRGGWGRFYELVAGNVQWNQSNQPPYSRTLAFSGNPLQVPTLTWSDAFPGTSVQGAPSVGVTGYPWKNPYNDNWNLTLQRQLLPSTSVEVGYVGTRGYDQPMIIDWNSAPFGNPAVNSQLLRPHPEHGSTTWNMPWGHSWYDSLQAKLQVRAKGLSILASYTWANDLTVGGGGINQVLTGSKYSWNFLGVRTPVLGTLSPNDPFLAIDKGPAAGDVRNHFSVSYVWDMPFGRGRKWNLSGPADWIAGGWELSGVTVLQSGYWIPIGCAFCTRPNLVGDPNSGAPHRVSEWFNTSSSIYQAPVTPLDAYNNDLNPLLTLGNAGRAPILGPGIDNWDLGIYKNFPFRERYRVQFRLEMFNAFNHANFGDPNTTYGSSATFGHISSAADGREIQLALKLYF